MGRGSHQRAFARVSVVAVSSVSLMFSLLLVSWAPSLAAAAEGGEADSNTTANSTVTECDDRSFLYNKTHCEPQKRLNLTVLRVTSSQVTFHWSLNDFDGASNLSLRISCTALGNCSCTAEPSVTTNRTFSISNLEAAELLRFEAVGRYKEVSITDVANVTVLTSPALSEDFPNKTNVTAANETSAIVEWSSSNSCNPIHIEFRTAKGNTLVGKAPFESRKALLSLLEPGAVTEVLAIAVVTAGGKSKTDSTSFNVTTKPMPPNSITVVARGSHSLTVTVVPPAKGGFDSIQLWRASVLVGQSKGSFELTGLQPYTTYQLRARSVFQGLQSRVLSGTVRTAEFTPGAPKGAALNNFVLSWTQPDVPNGRITGYQVEWSASCGKVESTGSVNLNSSTTEWTVPQKLRSAGQNLSFKVRAINSHSAGNWTSSLSQILPAPKWIKEFRLGSPGEVSWKSDVCRGFVVSYLVLLRARNPNTNATEGPCLSGSQHLLCSNCKAEATLPNEPCAAGGKPSPTSLAFNSTFATTLASSSFTAGRIYEVALLAVSFDNKTQQAAAFLRIPQVKSGPTPPPVPTPQPKSVQLKWRAPSDPGGLILNYVVHLNSTRCFLCTCTNCTDRYDFVDLTAAARSELEGATKGCLRSPAAPCQFPAGSVPESFSITDLKPYTLYSGTLAAVNSLGLGSAVPWEVTTLEGIPEPPTDLQFVDLASPTALNLTWTKSANFRGRAKGYVVQLTSSSGPVREESTTNQTFLFTNLTACTSYSAVVWSENGRNRSQEASKSVSAVTAPDKPGKVGSVSLLVLNESSMRANWTPVPRVGGCQMLYNVSLRSADDERSYLNITKKLSVVFFGLHPHVNYTAEVRAIAENSKGLRSPAQESTKSNVTKTKEGIPSPPNDLECSSPNFTTLSCSWKAPSKPHGIVRYRVVVSVGGMKLKNVTTADRWAVFPLNVSSKVTITVTVQAFTSAGHGTNQSVTASLQEGPPPKPNPLTEAERKQLVAKAQDVKDPQTQVKLSVYFGWFSDKYGDIIEMVVIMKSCVSPGACGPLTGKTSGLGNATDNLLSYTETAAGAKAPYAAVLLKSLSSKRTRRKRSAAASEQEVIIGKKSHCERTEKVCNGPLAKGTTYKVFLRGATSKGYTTIEGEVVSTEAPASNDLAIGLGVALPLLILAAVAVFFLVRRLRRGEKQPKVPDREETEMKSLAPTQTAVSDLAAMISAGEEVSIPVDQFPEFVEEMDRDSRLKYTDAFNELKKIAMQHEREDGLTLEEAGQQYNRLKNRFANILPFDQTRVCLSSDEDPNSGMDYVNANFISGYRRKREFVACQGPLPQTVDDFWRLVWEQNVSLVVMLTKVVEKCRNKCEQYWPGAVNETCVYGDLAVRLQSESMIGPYYIRTLTVVLHDETRRLTHIQMIMWDDFSAPTAEDMTALMQAYRSHLPLPDSTKGEAPTIVHCSAGVGRTGTFICLDTLLRKLEAGHSTININQVIYAMRRQRRHMVQSERQYIFIHDFLVSYLQQRRAPPRYSLATRPGSSPALANGGEKTAKLLDAEFSHVNDAYVREDTL